MNALAVKASAAWKKALGALDDEYSVETRQFLAFLEERRLALEPASIRAYLDWLVERGYAPATINKRLAAVKSRIRWLFAHSPDVLDTAKRIRLEEALAGIKGYTKADRAVARDRCLTSEEVRRLLSGCSEKLRLIIRLLATEGLRVSEATGIRLSDIRDAGPYALIRIRGKGRKQREVKIGHPFLAELRAHFQGKTYLLETATGRRYRRESLHGLIAKKGRAILGKPIGCHTFRHSFAYVQRIERGLPLEALSAYLGHASVATTAEMYLPKRTFSVDELPDFGGEA